MSSQKETLSGRYNTLLEHAPKVVPAFVPSNGAEQKQSFLRNDIRNPDHTYDDLNKLDLTAQKATIFDVGAEILENPELNPRFAEAYEESIEIYKKKTQLLELARALKHTDEPEEKARLRSEYMTLNIELYGEPDEQTYRSLLQEKLQRIADKKLSARGEEIKVELFGMVNYDELSEPIERFKPAEETVEWMHEVADTLYGGMLRHLPDKKKFSAIEIRELFAQIIRDEFGEAAVDWRVDIENAAAITVKPLEKRIVIPEGRNGVSKSKLRKLVVHELGVHMLRSVIGDETDLHPLSVGLEGYYDAEEGLGAVMEQALEGTFREAGIEPYITAGAAYFDTKDFREVYEMKWRMEVLNDADDGKLISPLAIAKAKKKAYQSAMRSFRGTDELPWFKDLAYYNGSVDVWRHLESIRGDDTTFMFVLMGKANPASKEHERLQYETSTP